MPIASHFFPGNRFYRWGDSKSLFLSENRALYPLPARAPHPEMKSDPALLEAKTTWMQKVAAAYGTELTKEVRFVKECNEWYREQSEAAELLMAMGGG